jgi:membrane protease YdiL (CAAX protease family)
MKSVIKQHPLLSYFVLAYGLSWIIWVPVGWAVSRVDEPPEWLFLLVVLGIYGASGAGFIMTGLVDGKPGVRRLLARVRIWRVGFQWYLVAFLAVPILILAGMALYALLGNPTGPFVPSRLPVLLLGAIPAIFFGPLGEEFGWRGFALPRLQLRYSAFWSSIILGILHTFWHTPLFFVGGVTFGTIGENGLVTVPLFLSWVTIGTFIYTFVFNNTAASMLMAILIHWSANTSDSIVFGLFPALPEPAQFQIMALAQIPGWIVVVLLIVVFGPTHLSRRSASQEPSPSG